MLLLPGLSVRAAGCGDPGARRALGGLAFIFVSSFRMWFCDVRFGAFCWSWVWPCALSRWKAVARPCVHVEICRGVEAVCRAGAVRGGR